MTSSTTMEELVAGYVAYADAAEVAAVAGTDAPASTYYCALAVLTLAQPPHWQPRRGGGGASGRY